MSALELNAPNRIWRPVTMKYSETLKFAGVLFASILYTIALLASVLFRHSLTPAFILILLVCLLERRYLGGIWWHRMFFGAWLGASFILTNWLVLSEGGRSEPAFVTFGPVFLIIAAYELIKHYSAVRHQS
jgi:hypothetical protein